jgi:hypothetical protein
VNTRDREVLHLLRDEPELLAIADAVAETQHAPRRMRPFRALAAVALAAAAIFALVLASPWDRGGGKGGVLDRAYAAVDSRGPVVHMTIRIKPPGRFSAVTTETFYDKTRNLLRVVTRSKESPFALADYTTKAAEDEFVTFPGLLDAADFYRTALATDRATVVGKGTWNSQSVYWVRLKKGGGLVLEVGVDRQSYRPVVFRGLNPDRSSAGFQVAVLGLEYVSPPDAHFQMNAPVLVTGTVVGPDCRPVRARVGASLSRSNIEIASARSGLDGRFTLRVDPRKSPLLASGEALKFTLVAQGNGGFRFEPFWRFSRDGRWHGDPRHGRAAPIAVRLSKGSSPSGC